MISNRVEAGPTERVRHWDRIWRERDPTRLSWYQARPETSLAFIERTGVPRGAQVLDVGGGASSLVEHLLERGYRPGVLDVSEEALARSRARMGPRAAEVEWFHADVTRWDPPHQWDLWHDRAVLHFLTDEADRQAYRATLLRALRPAGQAVIAEFGPEGPQSCSGLEVRRYSAEELEALLGPEFQLEEQATEEHRTPSGGVQRFLVCRLRRVPVNG
jgi:trans-aconitate methyltransferase